MKIIISFFILCCISPTFAQQNKENGLLTKHLSRKTAYTIFHTASDSVITIPCDFGKPKLRFPANIVDLSAVQVTAIYLVFTDYPAKDDLIQLNSKRLQFLFAKYPSLATNKNIEWNVIRQMDGAERMPAMNLFHGFVIYYRPLQNKTTIEKDLEELKTLLTPDTVIVKKHSGFVAADTNITKLRYEVEEYTAVIKLPVAEALAMVNIDPREKTAYKDYDSLFVYLKPLTDSTVKTNYKTPPDSTIIKVMDRMAWNDMLVTADVTASMYPYTGQLLLWLKLHEDERRIKQFTFFNDGDDKEDDAKIIGSTGGIYSTSSSVFEVVEQLIYKVMGNGNGGNIPENNIEALLQGINNCSGCGNTILIADNASGVSDISLLKQVTKPVHIIVCGVHNSINTAYLDIARSTGGSVHTAEEDLQLSISLQEGASITLHGKKYTIVNGRFKAE